MNRDVERCHLEDPVFGPGDGPRCTGGPADGGRFVKTDAEPARVIVAVMGRPIVRDFASAVEANLRSQILYYVPGGQFPLTCSLIGVYVLRDGEYMWHA